MTGYSRLSEAQQELLERATALGHDAFAPLAEQGMPGEHQPAARARALGEEGLLERVLPREGEGSAVELCLLREGLAHGCTEAETALALQGLGRLPDPARRPVPRFARPGSRGWPPARPWPRSRSASRTPAPTLPRSRCAPSATATGSA